MKIKITLFFLFSGFLIHAQDFKTALDYLNYIDKEQKQIARSTWKYTSAVAHAPDARRIETTRIQLIKSIQNASKKIGALKNGYKGDVVYRNKIIEYLYFAEKNINEEYSKIINLQDVAQQSYDYMETYVLTRDLVNQKLDEEFEKVKLAQDEFAYKYKINLATEESELGKKIRVSNEVFEYHTKLFLLFFKANITDVNLSKAIENKDISVIEQYATSLNRYADEGLEEIETLSPYKDDSSLINETKKALLFYKNTAQEFVPKVISYLLSYEKFEHVKKIMQYKSEDDRTVEEVNDYNAMVKQINNEIAVFNTLNDDNYKGKTEVLNNWNAVGDSFITNYIPED